MSEEYARSLEHWGANADALGILLSKHAFLVILGFSLVFTAILIIANRNRQPAKIAGRIGKVVGLTMSTVIALTALLPFVARAFWGTLDKPRPSLPACFYDIGGVCSEKLDQYFSDISQATVPVSTLLGVAMLSLFLASIVWFITSFRDALKA